MFGERPPPARSDANTVSPSGHGPNGPMRTWAARPSFSLRVRRREGFLPPGDQDRERTPLIADRLPRKDSPHGGDTRSRLSRPALRDRRRHAPHVAVRIRRARKTEADQPIVRFPGERARASTQAANGDATRGGDQPGRFFKGFEVKFAGGVSECTRGGRANPVDGVASLGSHPDTPARDVKRPGHRELPRELDLEVLESGAAEESAKPHHPGLADFRRPGNPGDARADETGPVIRAALARPSSRSGQAEQTAPERHPGDRSIEGPPRSGPVRVVVLLRVRHA